MDLYDLEHATSLELKKLHDRIDALVAATGETDEAVGGLSLDFEYLKKDTVSLVRRLDAAEKIIARQAVLLDRQAFQIGRLKNLITCPPTPAKTSVALIRQDKKIPPPVT